MSISEYVDKCVEKGNYETSDDGYIKVTVSDYKPDETVAEYMDRMVAHGKYEKHKGELISVHVPRTK